MMPWFRVSRTWPSVTGTPLLGDFQLAEDAAQEAFIEAYPILHRVYGPGVFPAWLRRLVFKQCDRLRRGKSIETVPMPERDDLPSGHLL